MKDVKRSSIITRRIRIMNKKKCDSNLTKKKYMLHFIEHSKKIRKKYCVLFYLCIVFSSCKLLIIIAAGTRD